jgi:hypothetical protein
MPARPERGKGRRKAKPPRAGEREAEGESDGEQSSSEAEGGGAFDLNRLETGGEGEDEDEAPQFLGDPLLYSHDAAESTSARRMMVFRGSVAGHSAVVLLDLGANANFVSDRWARSRGLRERPMTTATEVTTATGKTHAATTQLDSTEVRVVGSIHRSSLIVVPLSTYDVILGTPWFKATRPQFDWAQWTCNGHAVYSQGGRSVGHPGRGARRLQSMAIGTAHQAVMGRLAEKYREVFAAKLPPRSTVQRAGALTHSFVMQDGARPTVDGERRKSPEELRLSREMVAEGEAAGLIEPSTSEWCSQLVMVVKKDQHGKPTGKPRFAVDYRRVNAMMKKDAHPLPLPEVMFAQLKGATIFSKLDLTKGFYQIALAPECREQLAFATPDGLRQWTVMPFGIANAPATFQREMQRVLRGRLDKSVMVYIDDILVFSRDAEEHAGHVEWVLSQLKLNGYYANPDKCEFFQERVHFLGHVISADGVAVQQHKVDAVAEWPQPQSVSDVRRYLGLTGYYRRFVQGYAAITAPLSDLTRKDTPFVWGQREEAAFVRLKAALASAPVLATPDNAKPYTLHTDASGYAVGATLSQRNAEGVLQPVAFLSKKMNGAQRNYPVHEWELLAIVEALKAWRCFLYGAATPIDIFTDHHSLQWINTQPNLSARQSRWVEQLQDYSFKVQHLKGADNGAADALSRRADHEAAHAAEAEARLRAGDTEVVQSRLRLETAALTRSRTGASAAASEKEARAVDDRVSDAEEVPASSGAPGPSVRGSSHVVAASLMDDIRRVALTDVDYYVPLLSRAEHLGLVVRHGLVYSPGGLLYIPKDKDVRATLVREVHDAPTGGHLGREKTYRRLTAAVYWQGVYEDVRDYVRSCVSCGQNKAGNRTASDFLHPLPIPARRWETISMDFVGPLPKTSKGHDFLLTVVDKFSKMVHLIPCTQKVTASDVAQLVYDGVVRLHGFPERILSDRDSRFTSHFWRALWKLTGTRLAMSTSYHPQTDGQTENVNRVAQDILRAYVREDRKDWDRYLTATEIAINSSRHASTGYTPYFLNHNQEVRLPFGLALREKTTAAMVPAAAKAMDEMQANDETARSRMAKAQAQQEKAANRHRRVEVYEVGQQVMMNTSHLAGYKHKLACRFVGPFRVVEVGVGTVRLELPSDMKVHDRVNVDKVKRYCPSVGEWPGRSQESRPLPVHVSDDGQEQYEVEAILGKREGMEPPPSSPSEDPSFTVVSGRRKVKEVMVTRYLVQWMGYSTDECSWEPVANLEGAMDLVVDYERRLEAESTGRPSVMMVVVSGGV